MYIAKSFNAWHIDGESFQVAVQNVVIDFLFDDFNALRRDIALAGPRAVEPEFMEDFDTVRIYSSEKEQRIYIRMLALGVSVGFDEDDYWQFCGDVLNFNPEEMLERPAEPRSCRNGCRDYRLEGGMLLVRHNGREVARWPICGQDKRYVYYNVIHSGGVSRRKIGKALLE